MCKSVEDAIQKGHLNCLKRLLDRTDQDLCILASKYGQLECLKFLREREVPWNENVYIWSVCHVDCLKYLHEHGCPINKNIVLYAIRQNQLESLKYLLQHYEPSELYYREALKCGSLEILKYLDYLNCPKPLSIVSTNIAIQYKHKHCLDYLCTTDELPEIRPCDVCKDILCFYKKVAPDKIMRSKPRVLF